MLLRAYRAADLPALIDVFTTSVHVLGAAYYSAEQRQAWAPLAADVAVWRTRLAELHVHVAERDGCIAGFIGFSADGHIDLLFVAPSAAGTGVAAALYQQCEAALRGFGAEELSTEASQVARGFFERQGFEVEAMQRVSRAGVELTRYAMRKVLLQ